MNINACRVFQTSVHDACLGRSDELANAKRLETPDGKTNQTRLDSTVLSCNKATRHNIEVNLGRNHGVAARSTIMIHYSSTPVNRRASICLLFVLQNHSRNSACYCNHIKRVD